MAAAVFESPTFRYTIADAEMQAILQALLTCLPGARGNNLYWKQIELFSDSQASLRRLRSSWNKDRRGMQSTCRLIRDCIRVLWEQHRTLVHLRWIPGHDDVPGNEAADALAKGAAERACQDAPDVQHGPASLATIRTEATAKMAAVEAECWSHLASHSILATGFTFSKHQMRAYFDLPVPLVKLIIQFRSGSLPTGDHMDRTGCRCSPDVKTTRDHLLLDCPSLRVYRDAVTRFLPSSEARSRGAILQGGTYEPAERRTAYLLALDRLLTEGYAILALSFPPRPNPLSLPHLLQSPSPPRPTVEATSQVHSVIDLTGDADSSSSSIATLSCGAQPRSPPRELQPVPPRRLLPLPVGATIVDLTADTSDSDTSVDRGTSSGVPYWQIRDAEIQRQRDASVAAARARFYSIVDSDSDSEASARTRARAPLGSTVATQAFDSDDHPKQLFISEG